MDARFGKGVKRVLVVETGEDGRRNVTTVYEKSRPKQKMTPNSEGVEKVVRGAARGLQMFAQGYLDRHDESNRRKPDGWMRDFHYNIYASANKASEKLKIYPFPVPYAEVSEEDDE